MKYYITARIEARYKAEVEADTLGEAMEKAEEKFFEADFGEAEDIERQKITVEDEDGNFYDCDN